MSFILAVFDGPLPVAASIDLWSAEDTVSLVPWVVAGLAVIVAAWCADRRNTRLLRLRRDLQSAENHNRQLDKQNRRLRWENAQLRGVQPSAALHLGIPRRKARRIYRAPAAPPPAWSQPDPQRPEPQSWPATYDTALVALVNDPPPGDDTEPIPFTIAEGVSV